jgi:hypothetical protein
LRTVRITNVATPIQAEQIASVEYSADAGGATGPGSVRLAASLRPMWFPSTPSAVSGHAIGKCAAIGSQGRRQLDGKLLDLLYKLRKAYPEANGCM